MTATSDNQILTCRICFAIGGRSEFVSPCACTGHKQWVHRTCLDSSRAVKNDNAFSRCTVCHTPFRLVCITNDTANDKMNRKLKMAWFLIRDFTLALIVSQLTIIMLGGLFYFIDNGKLVKELGMEAAPGFVYYVVGLFLSIVFLGVTVMSLRPMAEPDSNTIVCCSGCYGCHGIFCYPFPFTEEQIQRDQRDWRISDYFCFNACDNAGGVSAIVGIFVFAVVYLFLFFGKSVWYIYYACTHHYKVIVKMVLTSEYIVSDVPEPTVSNNTADYAPPAAPEKAPEDDIESVSLFDHMELADVNIHGTPPMASTGMGFWGKGQQLYSALSGKEDYKMATTSQPKTAPKVAPTPAYEQRQALLSNAQRLELVSLGLL